MMRHVLMGVWMSFCSICVAGGTAVGWGDPTSGKNNLPSLPAGVTYTAVATGDTFSLGLRSDGLIETAGTFNGSLSLTPPPLPVGGAYVGIAAGNRFALGLRLDGQVVGWGDTHRGQASAPPLPTGMKYVAVSSGEDYSLALRSDGNIFGFGDSKNGQTEVPPLPAGLRYNVVSAGVIHGLAVRSDGVIVGWGQAVAGSTTAPPLPAGVRYTGVAAGKDQSLALRSDGTIVAFGSGAFGQSLIPPLPENTTYTAVAKGVDYSAAIRSDGQIVVWGRDLFSILSPPPLSPGTSYASISSGGLNHHFLAIAADGLPLGTAFVYQGLLKQGGLPLSGDVDLRFSLYRSDIGSTLIGAAVVRSAVNVSQGVFATELDFGSAAFDGTARWLGIEVQNPAGVGGFQLISPRARIAPSPMALTTPGFKSFILEHPIDTDRYLVHVALEGPEVAVFYRGSAKLESGRAVVTLPAYFDALTRREGRTIQLTNVGGFDPIAVQESAAGVFDGNSFTVCAKDPRSTQQFYWEVKAVRADGASLNVEPLKSDIRVQGDGPYTYALPAAAHAK